MFIRVNGAKLYFDVDGVGLVPDGSAMREKPTLLLLHGGPGADHSIYKPAFSALSDIAQVIFLDHRGNGRSSLDDPATWTLPQWGDDVKGFCDALGIVRPIVFGASFGGFVAQSYATRHPGHPAKLILASTAAKVDFPTIFDAFERLGGIEARQTAEAYWLAPSADARKRYFEVCLPLYRAKPATDTHMMSRAIIRNEVAIHFNGPANEQGRMDFRHALGQVQCQVPLMAGNRDPIMPIAFTEEIARCLPVCPVRFERFPGCSHVLQADDPRHFFQVLRDFITDQPTDASA